MTQVRNGKTPSSPQIYALKWMSSSECPHPECPPMNVVVLNVLILSESLGFMMRVRMRRDATFFWKQTPAYSCALQKSMSDMMPDMISLYHVQPVLYHVQPALTLMIIQCQTYLDLNYL